jgi:predicted site-specific integrase-resolvase
VPSSLFLQIYLHRAGAGTVVVLRSERVRFPEEPCELAEQRGPACICERHSSHARKVGVSYRFSRWALQRERALRE